MDKTSWSSLLLLLVLKASLLQSYAIKVGWGYGEGSCRPDVGPISETSSTVISTAIDILCLVKATGWFSVSSRSESTYWGIIDRVDRVNFLKTTTTERGQQHQLDDGNLHEEGKEDYSY